MTKRNKKIAAALCCTGLLVLGSVGLAQAQSPTILAGGARQDSMAGPGVESERGQDLDMIRIWGPVLAAEDGVIRIDNQSGVSYEGEIVLNVDSEYSRVLDAENGFPAQLGDIKAGEFIYAYIGPAMTMSLPPMTTAEMVICHVPQDKQAPDYVQVKSMKQGADGNWSLTAAGDYTMFNGLTRIDTTDAVWLSLLKFSPEARISYVDTDDRLDTISKVLDPENIRVLHIGIMGTNLEGIGQYKNLEELEVESNLSAQSVDVSSIEQCSNLKSLRLRCGESYTGLEKIGALKQLKSLYVDQAFLGDCTFLTDLPQLESLSVKTGAEASLSILESLPNLKQVAFLDQEYIPSGEIHRLQGVKELSLAVNEAESLYELAALNTLEALKLHMSIKEYNVPVDVSPLGALEGLERLWLDNFWGGEMAGAEKLFNLPSLTVLWIGRKGTSDVELLLDTELLQNNPSIQELGLWACYPESAADGEKLDYTFILHYPGIKRLYLEDCDLEDISFVSELEDLRACSLQQNKISSLLPLLACKKLEIVAADADAAAGVRFPADVVVDLEPFARIFENEA